MSDHCLYFLLVAESLHVSFEFTSKFYWLASMLFGCILVWFLYVNMNQLVWFPNANLLLIVVLNGIMDFAYVVSFVFLWGAGTCLELMVVYSLWNSLCACIAHLLASPIFGCGLNSKHPWPHASWRTRKKVWL
jgi:multidrug transporter EmrE-like cation transporter